MDNKFYIYIHKVKDAFELDGFTYQEGTIVYIGRGTKGRLNKKSDRSTKHKLVWDFLEKKIVKSNLTLAQAIEEESALLMSNSDNVLLFNKHVCSGKVSEIHSDYFSKYFYLSPTSESGLAWKVDVYKKKCKDKIAGTKQKSGHWIVRIHGKRYYVHRIIYSIAHNLSVPIDMVINHIDGNPSNNLVSNLELVTVSENTKKSINKSLPKSGFRGLYDNSKLNRWEASFTVDFKPIRQLFYYKDDKSKKDMKNAAISWLEKSKTAENGY